MKLIKRDLEPLKLYKHGFLTDSDGDITLCYTDCIHFDGHLQPSETFAYDGKYGMNMIHMYKMYTIFDKIAELDKISNENDFFIVKTVQKWKTYYKVMLEGVTDD